MKIHQTFEILELRMMLATDAINAASDTVAEENIDDLDVLEAYVNEAQYLFKNVTEVLHPEVEKVRNETIANISMLDELDADLWAKDADLFELQDKFTDAKIQKSQQETMTEIDNVKAEIVELKTEYIVKELEEKLNSARNEYEDTQNMLESVKVENNHLTKKIHDRQDQIKKQDERIITLRDKISKVNGEIDNLNKQKEQRDKAFTESTTDYAKKERTFEHVKEVLKSVNSKLPYFPK